MASLRSAGLVLAAGLALVMALSGCPKATAGLGPARSSPGGAPTPNVARMPSLDAGDPLYDRYEGTAANNACGSDADCTRSGCDSEVCAADVVVTTCDVVRLRPGRVGASRPYADGTADWPGART